MTTDFRKLQSNLLNYLNEGKINESQEDIRIEYPSMGTTYNRKVYGVYKYDEYPSSSVLAGEERRVFLDDFPTLDATKKAYPHAEVIDGSSFYPKNLNHLPGEDD